MCRDAGYVVCMKCGTVATRELDTNVISYQQSLAFASPSYSRKSRFCRKIIGSLTGRLP